MTIRDHILSVGERLFYEAGTHEVGIDRLIAESGVAKATLYRHFPSKAALIEAYLRERHERVVAAFSEQFAETALSAEERLLRIFDLLRERSETGPFRGCAFLIAVVETEGGGEIAEIARLHKRSILALFCEVAKEITPDFERLGEDLALCYEGALASTAISRDPGSIDIARRCAAVLIATRTRSGASETSPPTQLQLQATSRPEEPKP